MTSLGKAHLTIIIISYNTKLITENCIYSILKSLKNSQLSIEIIIIDNDSSDGSKEMLKKFQKMNFKKTISFHTIFNERNVGFAKANNQGVKNATGNYILFLNSDIIVLNHAIDELFNFYKQNENSIHFLGGKLLNEDLTPQPSCGPFYSLPIIFAALFLRGDYYGFTRYSPDSIKEVDWISGACILTKKIYFEKIFGFDENIFMYMDEIDLLYRAKKTGLKVFYYPKSEFIHLGSASSKGRTQPILQVFKGFIYFYKKHHNDPISLFLLRIMLQLKSYIALLIGKCTHNSYLIETYEKALKLV